MACQVGSDSQGQGRYLRCIACTVISHSYATNQTARTALAHALGVMSLCARNSRAALACGMLTPPGAAGVAP